MTHCFRGTKKRTGEVGPKRSEDPLKEDRIIEARIHRQFERMSAIKVLAENLQDNDRRRSAKLFENAAIGYLAIVKEIDEKPYYCGQHDKELATRYAISAFGCAADAMSFLDEEFTKNNYAKAIKIGVEFVRKMSGETEVATRLAGMCEKALGYLDPESKEAKEMKDLQVEMTRVFVERPVVYGPISKGPLPGF